MDNRKVSRQHEPLRVPQGWKGQDKALVIQLERVVDDIYNLVMKRVVSVLGIKPDKDGNIVLTKEAIKGLGIPDNDDLDDYAKTTEVSAKLASKFPRVQLSATEKIKFTAGSRRSFIVLVCGGTNSYHRGAYLCFAGTDAETYQVETLLDASTVTVAASATGITFTNSSTLKYVDVIDPSDTVSYTIT